MVCQYDGYQKLILTHPSVLPWIIRRVIPQFRNLLFEEISKNYLKDAEWNSSADTSFRPYHTMQQVILSLIKLAQNPKAKPRVMDIHIRLKNPEKPGTFLRLNLEASRNPLSYDLTKRSIIYVGENLSSQDANSDYNDIKYFYLVWFLLNSKEENLAHKVAHLQLWRKFEGQELPELVESSPFEIVELTLSNTPGTGPDTTMNMLEVLSS